MVKIFKLTPALRKVMEALEAGTIIRRCILARRDTYQLEQRDGTCGPLRRDTYEKLTRNQWLSLLTADNVVQELELSHAGRKALRDWRDEHGLP